jgi:hypothetical protein
MHKGVKVDLEASETTKKCNVEWIMFDGATVNRGKN